MSNHCLRTSLKGVICCQIDDVDVSKVEGSVSGNDNLKQTNMLIRFCSCEDLFFQRCITW